MGFVLSAAICELIQKYFVVVLNALYNVIQCSVSRFILFCYVSDKNREEIC